MIAAQLLAAHNATMECYRRAMIAEQSFEGRREALNQANKLSRTYTTLLEALNRHRGKGQQKVTVEHVHVHAGGQAVVGMVEAPGGGDRPKSEDQPHAKQITHASQPSMWGADRSGKPCQITSDAERAMPDARRKVSGRAEGQSQRMEAWSLFNGGHHHAEAREAIAIECQGHSRALVRRENAPGCL